jgi:hypothetical protein
MLKTIAQDSRQSWKTLGIIYCILPLVKTSNCYRKDGASIEAKLLLPLMCWPIHHLVHGCTGILGSLDYGIYPKLTRLLKGMKEPVSQKTNIFTNWQEAVRKDIERTLAVLQAKSIEVCGCHIGSTVKYKLWLLRSHTMTMLRSSLLWTLRDWGKQTVA